MKTDIVFENHGTVVLIRPLSQKAREWADENIHTEDWQHYGGAIAADPRYVQDVYEGAKADGLTVEIAR